MRRLNRNNINSQAYFDSQFMEKDVDMENTLRQDKYLDILSRYDIKSLIELGCGVSAFLPMAAERYEEVWGLDFSPLAVAKMKKEFPNVKYIVGDATDTEFDDESFDAVVSGELLEHLEDPKSLVEEMNRICRPGGIMLLSTPQLEFDDPEHLWEFDLDDLSSMFSVYGDTSLSTLESKKFPGRKYLIVWTKKEL